MEQQPSWFQTLMESTLMLSNSHESTLMETLMVPNPHGLKPLWKNNPHLFKPSWNQPSFAVFSHFDPMLPGFG
jgi:hypothetical protein